ncbi:hypothetical protein DCAR_0207904 [Daucus carota subsp. sativus]|uniref:Uncharacterized protein n=2 Tax=Daucus carota subsp. sativus TaxID=79200 RepID=A0A162AUP1_DAUCS|nr:hypothetical protein DCAR_0207904 [Daucus carota subsp. sativus]
MESSSREKVELIQQTIQRLITDDDGDSDSSSDGNEVNGSGELNRRGRRRLVLTGLLSQLDTIKADEAEEIACADGEVEHIVEPLNKTEVGSCGMDNEEIAQELKRVRKQNLITHCLLIAMIGLTIVWQIGEVSLLLWLKNGVTHPVRSFGGMVKGMLLPNGRGRERQQSFTKEKLNSTKEKFMEALKKSSTRDKLIESLETIKQSSARDKLIEALEAIESSPIQGIKIPELLRMELPSFDSSTDEA